MFFLKAGEYIIADPIRVLKDTNFNKLLKYNKTVVENVNESFDLFENVNVEGGLSSIVVYKASFGESLYESNGFGFFDSYSGMIGAFPLKMCCPYKISNLEDSDIGIKIYFKSETQTNNINGVLVFGSVYINTGIENINNLISYYEKLKI